MGSEKVEVCGLRFACTLCTLLATSSTWAADPQSYEVHFADTHDKALNDMLESSSELVTLRKTAPVSPFGLIGRARGDLGRFKTVLESFGYYQSTSAITIDGLQLDDPALSEELAQRSGKDEARVNAAFERGPLYRLGKIELVGDVPPKAAAALNLSSGAPAVASDVVAAGDRVRQTLQDDGFAYAKVDPPHAVENPDEHTLDVSFKVTPGERHELGEIRLEGLTTTRESFVRRRLLVHPGELYRASAIEAARKDLLTAGVFTQVSVTADPQPDAQGNVPLTFKIRERKPHAAGAAVAYSSDLGASVGVNWLKREISGVADPFSVSASVINLGGGTASNGVGYDLHGSYQIPDWKLRGQTLQFDAGALRQSLDAYDQTALKTGVSVRRKLSRLWTVSAGITAEHEQIVQESPPDPVVSADVGCTRNIARPRPGTSEPRCTYHYTLLGVPIAAIYNTTGLDSPLEDATKGVRASLTVTPTFALGHQRSQFVVTELSAATYFDLAQWGLTSDRGRSVLAVRALAGLAGGANEFSLPPDQRFYAGGSGTIRGYRYQSVGPAFPDGNPIGGTAINAASVEFRQRIGEALGFAVFVDAGNVSDTLNPLHGSVRTGAGAGFRYYTALGPLRVDLAVPLQRRSGPGFKDDAFEVYIGLGQAF